MFARKTGLPSILPHVLYDYIIHLSSPSQIGKSEHASSGSVVCLPIQDQLASLIAYHRICKAQAETTYSWAFRPESLSPDCTSIQCSLARQKYVIRKFTPLPRYRGLDSLHDALSLVFLEKLCFACSHIALEMHKAGREKFWEILPSLFDLPPWDELAKEREKKCTSLLHDTIGTSQQLFSRE
ncbi:hypothetical protein FIBSPDRAFT_105038 [Athelia psychrophila]|uniref:Uncharacterized protein n=1 Tax=Athelia psychrophila TaxID=1759441 RepID=A0A166DAV7_9AGAM|nr:hypothetical protein FIBSPDRAFT_105038 [Fibularhizoctonia sp. CBS 109695]